MKKCPNCGCEIENDNVKFCPQCGANLESSNSISPFSFMNNDNNANKYSNENKIEKYVHKWNWGAFLLFGIWGFFNGAWIEALVVWGCSFLIPYGGFLISLGVSIYFGIKGNEIAWKRKNWQSFEDFKRIQKKWAISGLVVTIIFFIIGLIGGLSGGY